jgi:hypothetical protein
MNVKGYYKRGRIFGYIILSALMAFIFYYLMNLLGLRTTTYKVSNLSEAKEGIPANWA